MSKKCQSLYLYVFFSFLRNSVFFTFRQGGVFTDRPPKISENWPAVIPDGSIGGLWRSKSMTLSMVIDPAIGHIRIGGPFGSTRPTQNLLKLQILGPRIFLHPKNTQVQAASCKGDPLTQTLKCQKTKIFSRRRKSRQTPVIQCLFGN